MNRLACAMAMSLLLWPACNTQQNPPSQDQHQKVEAAKQERQAFQDKVQAQLRELDQEIDSLKTKMESQKKVDRRQAEKQMTELQRKSEIAHQRLEKLQDSSEQAWGDMKVGINAAMDDLANAYERAASHFK